MLYTPFLRIVALGNQGSNTCQIFQMNNSPYSGVGTRHTQSLLFRLWHVSLRKVRIVIWARGREVLYLEAGRSEEPKDVTLPLRLWIWIWLKLCIITTHWYLTAGMVVDLYCLWMIKIARWHLMGIYSLYGLPYYFDLAKHTNILLVYTLHRLHRV